MSKNPLWTEGRKFARVAMKDDAGKDVYSSVRPQTPSPVTAQIIGTRKKIVQYAQGNGFAEDLAGTIAQFYPRFETADICQAVKACSAQGCRNPAGFRTNLMSIAGGKKR